MNAAAHFAPSYREARARFLGAAEAAGLDAHHEMHPLLGRDGEELALDIVRDGPPDAAAVLLISSACHGVEGHCGSGVQVALLRDAAFRATARDAGVALVFLHALNPYGFSWCRRVTQENVDLNRNFIDFHAPLPRNPDYDELAALLVPAHWPPGDAVAAGIARFIAEHGPLGFQAAVSRGQYDHPQGLFFGGQDPTWSHVALRHALRDHGRRCRRLGWIDVHTGLGPEGHGERIYAGRDDDRAALARAKAWWGDAVTATADGSSNSAALSGQIFYAAYEECPQAEYTGIALEYGTVPIAVSLDALRADQWLENHPEADAATRTAIKQRMRDCFYIDTDTWKAKVLEQAFDAARAALRGLSAA
jgi:hypothetical protein